MGITLFSLAFAVICSALFSVIIKKTHKHIVDIGNGILLKFVCLLASMRSLFIFTLPAIGISSLKKLPDTSILIQSICKYRIDYYVKDVYYEYMPLRPFPVLVGLAILVFVVGAIVYSVKDFRKYYSMQRKLKQLKLPPVDARYTRIAQKVRDKLGCKVKGRIIQHHMIAIPSVSGLFRPTIYLPERDWSDEQLEDVFEHEYYHFLHADSWMKIILLINKNLNWYDRPLRISFVHMITHMEQACEYHCDRSLTRNRDHAGRLRYANTLATVVEHAAEWMDVHSALITGLSAFVSPDEEEFIKDRIRCFMNDKPSGARKKKAQLFALAITLLFALSLVPNLINFTPMVDASQGEYGFFVDNHDGTYDFYGDGAYKFTIASTESEIETMVSSEYIFDQIPDLEIIKNSQ